MRSSFKEIDKRAEDLMEQGSEAEQQVKSWQNSVSSAQNALVVARARLAAACTPGPNGAPIGDIAGAQVEVIMAESELAACQRQLEQAEWHDREVKNQKRSLADDIKEHNKTSRSALAKLDKLRSLPFGERVEFADEDMARRHNEAEDIRAMLLRSVGIEYTPDYVQVENVSSARTWQKVSLGNLDLSAQPHAHQSGALYRPAAPAPVGGGLGPLNSRSSAVPSLGTTATAHAAVTAAATGAPKVSDASVALASARRAFIKKTLIQSQNLAKALPTLWPDLKLKVPWYQRMRQPWPDSLSQDERRTVSDYTGEGKGSYKLLNGLLRKRGDFTPDQKAFGRLRIKMLHSALSRTGLEHETTLYRGLWNNRLLGKYQNAGDGELVGKFIKEPAFMSTTTDESVAREVFARDTVLVVSAPAGSRGAAVGAVSQNRRESERLFDRGQWLRIDRVERKRAFKGGVEKELRYIHCTLVPKHSMAKMPQHIRARMRVLLRGPSSPPPEYIGKVSWEEVRDELDYANLRIPFGSASAHKRRLTKFPALQTQYEALARRGEKIGDDFLAASHEAGGVMYGKETGVKGAGSLERKIHDKVRRSRENGSDKSASEVFEKMTDVIRYTALAAPDDFAKVAGALVHSMERRGYKLVEVENKWLDARPYNGLHYLFAKDGVTFEAQVHTPNSMSVKEKQHFYYEIERDATWPESEREHAFAKQRELAKEYVRPAGVDSFPNWSLKKNGGTYRAL